MTQSGVLLTVGDTVRLDFTLEIGAFGETVMVESQARLINTEEGRISALVDEKRVSELPLNGRNVFQLMELQPGATGNPGNVVLGGTRRRRLGVHERPAQSRQQLPARRHRQQRSVHGRPRRRQSERGHRPGVPRVVQQHLRGVWPQQRLGGQRRHQAGRQPRARHRLRVLPQRRDGRKDRVRHRQGSALVQPVRRHDGRSDSTGQNVLLLRLRRTAPQSRRHAGADRRDARVPADGRSALPELDRQLPVPELPVAEPDQQHSRHRAARGGTRQRQLAQHARRRDATRRTSPTGGTQYRNALQATPDGIPDIGTINFGARGGDDDRSVQSPRGSRAHVVDAPHGPLPAGRSDPGRQADDRPRRLQSADRGERQEPDDRRHAGDLQPHGQRGQVRLRQPLARPAGQQRRCPEHHLRRWHDRVWQPADEPGRVHAEDVPLGRHGVDVPRQPQPEVRWRSAPRPRRLGLRGPASELSVCQRARLRDRRSARRLDPRREPSDQSDRTQHPQLPVLGDRRLLSGRLEDPVEPDHQPRASGTSGSGGRPKPTTC